MKNLLCSLFGHRHAFSHRTANISTLSCTRKCTDIVLEWSK